MVCIRNLAVSRRPNDWTANVITRGVGLGVGVTVGVGVFVGVAVGVPVGCGVLVFAGRRVGVAVRTAGKGSVAVGVGDGLKRCHALLPPTNRAAPIARTITNTIGMAISKRYHLFPGGLNA
jgi:hypothetical protein